MNIGVWKSNFFGALEFFSWILISKRDVKINFRIITKNHAAYPEIRFLTKSISKPYGRATAIPTAWDLNLHICYTQIRSTLLAALWAFFSAYFSDRCSFYFIHLILKLSKSLSPPQVENILFTCPWRFKRETKFSKSFKNASRRLSDQPMYLEVLYFLWMASNLLYLIEDWYLMIEIWWICHK